MKAQIIAASAALIGSVAAAHKAHAGFHLRRGGYADSEVCTVYTTVYVTASELPPMAANSTVYIAPSPVPETSTPCTEEKPTSPAYTPPAPLSTSVYTPPPPPPSSEKVYTPPAPVSTEEAKPSKEAYTPPAPASTEGEAKPSKEAYTPPAPAYTPSPVSSKPVESTPKPSTPASGGDYSKTGRIVTKGDKWAITYTPYSAGGDCKSAGEVKSDIKKIADMGFTTIRSYSTDCGVFENVVPECQKYGLKVIYGIFLEAGGAGGKGPGSEYANKQLQDIIDNAPKDSIAMIIVGNEAIFNNYCTAEELGAYIDYVKKTLTGAGFPSDIAVTTTETVDVWEQKGAALCSHIDVFGVQVHPFFTSKVTASEAGEFAKQQLEQAAKVCPEVAAKGKYITEIGWPKSGQANGNAVPGKSEQAEAIKSIVANVGTEACLFSFQDDLWKAPGAFGVEQSFGCADVL